MELRAAAAKALRVHFSKFNLPDGARLVVRGSTGEEGHVYGGKGLPSNGSFWSAAVAGEVAYIEYQDPTGRAAAPVIEIDEISHVYRDGGFDVAPQQGAAAAGLLPCEEDVNCHTVDQAAKDSVGRILFTRPGEGTFVCSGALLNDADTNTFAGYFLTANHCLDTQVMVDSVQVRWFYETDTCNGTSSWVSTSFGGTLLATSPNSDFTFLRLSNDPDDGQGFAAWTTAAPSGTVRGIHHPGGSFKRFSEGFVTTAAPICGTLPLSRFVYNDWTTGTTEGGSSGSPLFNTSWQVVGQLFGICFFTGTTRGCNNPQDFNNLYGRFATTFPSVSSFLNTITPDDPFEDNDSLPQAAQLDLGLHSLRLVDFDDYFRVRVCGSNTLTVTATFDATVMDLDLELLTTQGSILDISNGTTGTEILSASVGPGDYVVHAVKFSGWGGDYSLNITAAPTVDCNGNGVADDCDIASGVSADCNINAIPDECESPVCSASLAAANTNGGGRSSSSTNYMLVASTAQTGGVGVVTSTNYELRDGFWDTVPPVLTFCPPDSNCDDADICTFDSCAAGVCSNAANTYGDVDFNNTVNLFDLFCVLDGFGGVFSGNCTFDRLDIEPCDGNGSLNLFDLFAILDSFSGIDPCCGALP